MVHRRHKWRRNNRSQECLMLSLNDEKWKHLTTFFGEPSKLPSVISDWLKTIGTEQEAATYYRDLFELFLHQGTITNAAFAVVPWLLHVCKDGATKLQIEYLTDIALVEANRLKFGLSFHRAGTEMYPDWLMPDYEQTIIESRQQIEHVLAGEKDETKKRPLVAMMPALFGNAELAWSQW